MVSPQDLSFILLQEFKEFGMRNENYIITHLENCLRQVYQFKRRFGRGVFLRGTYMCRQKDKNNAECYSHIQIISNGKFYDPCFDYFSNENTFLSDYLIMKNTDQVGEQIVNNILRNQEPDLRRCEVMTFPDYLNFHRETYWGDTKNQFRISKFGKFNRRRYKS